MVTERALTIKGFEFSGFGTMLQWVDSHGLHHSTELEEAYRYCERGQYGLSKDDRKKIRRAFNKHMAELDLGRPIPGEWRELGASE